MKHIVDRTVGTYCFPGAPEAADRLRQLVSSLAPPHLAGKYCCLWCGWLGPDKSKTDWGENYYLGIELHPLDGKSPVERTALSAEDCADEDAARAAVASLWAKAEYFSKAAD